MKFILGLTFAIVCVLMQTSQADTLRDYKYRVNGLVYVFEYDKNKGPADLSRFTEVSRIAHIPLRFEIEDEYAAPDKMETAGAGGTTLKALGIQPGETVYVIKFGSIVANAADTRLKGLSENLGGKTSTYITSADTDKESYFWINKRVLDAYVDKGFIVKEHKLSGVPSLTWGATLSIPIKIRPKIADNNRKFETDANFGGYVGAQWRLSATQSIFGSLIATVGGVALPINAGNTMPATGDKDTTALGFSWGVGAILELDDFQVGVMLGRDYAASDWVYNTKTWYCLSVGGTFLKNVGKK